MAQQSSRVALVLGTSDIASAIGHALFASGWRSLLCADPASPVLRRGMAFDDALIDGTADLLGVRARRAMTLDAVGDLLAADIGVVVTALACEVLLATTLPRPDLLVDARLHKQAAKPDMRPLACLTVGIGPGFVAGGNVHVAVETMPGSVGRVLFSGETARPTGRSEVLGGARNERFVYAPVAAPWRTAMPLGVCVAAGDVLGHLGSLAIAAPLDGLLCGLVRDSGAGVPRGTKLLEVDPRGAGGSWSGIRPRARGIADCVLAVLATAGLARPPHRLIA